MSTMGFEGMPPPSSMAFISASMSTSRVLAIFARTCSLSGEGARLGNGVRRGAGSGGRVDCRVGWGGNAEQCRTMRVENAVQ